MNFQFAGSQGRDRGMSLILVMLLITILGAITLVSINITRATSVFRTSEFGVGLVAHPPWQSPNAFTAGPARTHYFTPVLILSYY